MRRLDFGNRINRLGDAIRDTRLYLDIDDKYKTGDLLRPQKSSSPARGAFRARRAASRAGKQG